jgi:hypothetical protein
MLTRRCLRKLRGDARDASLMRFVLNISDFRRDRLCRFRASGRLLAAQPMASSGWSRASAPTGDEASGRSTRGR